MNNTFLFPRLYYAFGWAITIPSAIFGFIVFTNGYEPEWSKWSWFAIRYDILFGDQGWFSVITTSMLNEIFALLLVVGLLLVAFSRRTHEDEFVMKLRHDSLLWATYINYVFLAISILFVFDMAFLWIMIANIYTLLILYIVRFEWVLRKNNKTVDDEE